MLLTDTKQTTQVREISRTGYISIVESRFSNAVHILIYSNIVKFLYIYTDNIYK